MSFYNFNSPKQQHRFTIEFNTSAEDMQKNTLPSEYIFSVERPNYEIPYTQAKFLFSQTYNFPKRLIWKPINLVFLDVNTETSILSEEAKLKISEAAEKGREALNALLQDQSLRQTIKYKVMRYTNSEKDYKADGTKKPAEFYPFSSQGIIYRFLLSIGYFSPLTDIADYTNDLDLRFKSFNFKNNMVESFRQLKYDGNALDQNSISAQAYFSIHELDGGGTKIESWKVYNPLVLNIRSEKLDYSNTNIIIHTISLAYDWAELVVKDKRQAQLDAILEAGRRADTEIQEAKDKCLKRTNGLDGDKPGKKFDSATRNCEDKPYECNTPPYLFKDGNGDCKKQADCGSGQKPDGKGGCEDKPSCPANEAFPVGGDKCAPCDLEKNKIVDNTCIPLDQREIQCARERKLCEDPSLIKQGFGFNLRDCTCEGLKTSNRKRCAEQKDPETQEPLVPCDKNDPSDPQAGCCTAAEADRRACTKHWSVRKKKCMDTNTSEWCKDIQGDDSYTYDYCPSNKEGETFQCCLSGEQTREMAKKRECEATPGSEFVNGNCLTADDVCKLRFGPAYKWTGKGCETEKDIKTRECLTAEKRAAGWTFDDETFDCIPPEALDESNKIKCITLKGAGAVYKGSRVPYDNEECYSKNDIEKENCKDPDEWFPAPINACLKPDEAARQKLQECKDRLGPYAILDGEECKKGDDTGECVSPNKKNKNGCRTPKQFEEDLCQDYRAGRIPTPSQENYELFEDKCISQTEICTKRSGRGERYILIQLDEADPQTKKCVTEKEGCAYKGEGYEFVDAANRCLSPEELCKYNNPKNIFTDGKCVTEAEQCNNQEGKRWTVKNGRGECLPNDEAEELEQEQECNKPEKKRDGYKFINGDCISKEEQCDLRKKDGYAWTITREGFRGKKTYGFECLSPAEQEEYKCSEGAASGMEMREGKCYTEEEICKKFKPGYKWGLGKDSHYKCLSPKEQAEAACVKPNIWKEKVGCRTPTLQCADARGTAAQYRGSDSEKYDPAKCLSEDEVKKADCKSDFWDAKASICRTYDQQCKYKKPGASYKGDTARPYEDKECRTPLEEKKKQCDELIEAEPGKHRWNSAKKECEPIPEEKPSCNSQPGLTDDPDNPGKCVKVEELCARTGRIAYRDPTAKGCGPEGCLRCRKLTESECNAITGKIFSEGECITVEEYCSGRGGAVLVPKGCNDGSGGKKDCYKCKDTLVREEPKERELTESECNAIPGKIFSEGECITVQEYCKDRGGAVLVPNGCSNGSGGKKDCYKCKDTLGREDPTSVEESDARRCAKQKKIADTSGRCRDAIEYCPTIGKVAIFYQFETAPGSTSPGVWKCEDEERVDPAACSATPGRYYDPVDKDCPTVEEYCRRRDKDTITLPSGAKRCKTVADEADEAEAFRKKRLAEAKSLCSKRTVFWWSGACNVNLRDGWSPSAGYPESEWEDAFPLVRCINQYAYSDLKTADFLSKNPQCRKYIR